MKLALNIFGLNFFLLTLTLMLPIIEDQEVVHDWKFTALGVLFVMFFMFAVWCAVSIREQFIATGK